MKFEVEMDLEKVVEIKNTLEDLLRKSNTPHRRIYVTEAEENAIKTLVKLFEQVIPK